MEPWRDFPCVLWSGPKNRKGYGRIGSRGLAHRRAWESAYGPVPAGLMVCHHCDVPACVEPQHLFVGTNADNMRDAARKGRLRGGRGIPGERNPQAKLTDTAVLEIRALRAQGVGSRRLARRFGVCRSTIKRILTGRKWAHVRAQVEA